MDSEIERLRTEAQRIEKAALWSAERHYAAETPWYMLIDLIGLPTAILSAIAGAAAFSKLNHSIVIAGTISLLVAILTAVSTRLGPEARAGIHHTTAKGYEVLYNQAGYFYRVESLSSSFSREELEKKLEVLTGKLNELNQNSPGIAGRAYRVAARKIQENRGEVVGCQTDERLSEAKADTQAAGQLK